MSSRKIKWVSCLDEKNKASIDSLQNELIHFYSSNPDYYKNINFTAESWVSKQEAGFREIVKSAEKSLKLLEVGCGSANVLQHHKELQSRYTGCDFSETLIKENASKYRLANFNVINTANQLPYGDETFDLVFSVYVIEHTTNPPRFLDECLRVLTKGGTLIILCPDFLGKGRMSSQRAGYSPGTTQDKLNQGKYVDALITYIDNRLKIPLYCKYLLLRNRNTPRFYINVFPTVFSDNFNPDVDAVYVTEKREMVTFLKTRAVEVSNSIELKIYEKRRKLIYLKLKKTN